MEALLTQSNAIQAPGRFDPYSNNGGTSIAIAGEKFCLIASDTRQSEGFLIQARFASKIFKLFIGRTEQAVLTFSGFHADGQQLVRIIRQRIEWYYHNHDKDMSIKSLAHLVHTVLYSRRFFPFYAFVVLAGVDSEGKGCVFNYDPVGSYERLGYSAVGSGTALLQPFLDNQVGKRNQQGAERMLPSKEQAIQLAKDAFSSATERDIYTGDQLQIFIIEPNTTMNTMDFSLKRD